MTSRNRWIRTAALGAACAVLLTACGGGSDDSESDGVVTLKVNDWGDFGLKDLITQYQKDHPNIKIVENVGDYDKQHQDLAKFLVAGSGAPDISAIDEGKVEQFRNMSDKFTNLLDLGAGEFESKYLVWKWKETLSEDGKAQIGLGTDVGGMAMCYRTDLFEKAGLPTDPDEVSALWPTWDKFIETGKKYQTGIKDPKKNFVDAASNILNPVLSQQPTQYFAEGNKLAMDQGPKTAWDISTKFIDEKLSANLVAFSKDWDAAFKTGRFATLACPAWMMGYIQGKSPEGSGKWNIAAVPGGSGNWGGSFWTIPKQGKHQKEAYEFIKWLVQPEQQIAIFKSIGNLPSQPALYEDPALLEAKSDYFSGAEIGKIFTKAAMNLKPQYFGPKNGEVRVAVEAVLTAVQQGKLTSAKGWDKAVEDAQKIADKG